jgi:hypothetical protein
MLFRMRHANRRRLPLPLACLAIAACTAPERAHRSSPPEDTSLSTTLTAPPPLTLGTESSSAIVEDVFDFVRSPADVLFVIDGSASYFVDDLLSALGGFVDDLVAQGTDFHAGAVDIDESADLGKLVAADGVKWAAPDSPNPGPAGVLRDLVGSIGETGPVEEGLISAHRALQLTGVGGPNEGFLRDDSDLAIVIFTDTPDQGDLDELTPSEFVDFLTVLRPNPKLISFDPIVNQDGDEYADVAASVGGVSWSIDNQPYGPALQAIADFLEGANTFVLSGNADPSSIQVHVDEPDGTSADLGFSAVTWNADAQSVELGDFIPQDGATVTIRYSLLDPPGT